MIVEVKKTLVFAQVRRSLCCEPQISSTDAKRSVFVAIWIRPQMAAADSCAMNVCLGGTFM
jgi:hypothetical protein